MSFSHYSVEMPTTDSALPGRKERMPVLENHFVIGNPLHPPFPPTMQTAIFGMGCFWGPERKFWEQQGVYTTAVGYTAGLTPNPTYEEICSGLTGHSEVVQIVFDPMTVTYRELLILFWECHDPTQGMRQGNDMGTQYRSGIYTFSEKQLAEAMQSKTAFQKKLLASGYGRITTEILPAGEFYFAEHYHQQYLAKVPNGYCGTDGTGIGFR
ncbi:MAG TPA: peptide-methionine (S)-S-oxide reductase MsrA [Pseudomonadales bacterium]|jgi:peptide-methionine (S)-S-oxide reductase|nr:peptide-methionine (S)-S-oxide reductase MsrA [Pseudomonadales bacterium]MDP6316368.1 peptide-methionine (S)-S-oxide reductase MsrA [Pseudomonadales bacterium]HJL62112.1 peptide-methionine (S)-S-oxide reductase MsrA [Pseudomonadales bacterium]